MSTKRYVFVLVLLIFAIAALSTVSAADLNTTDEVIGDEIAVDNELEQTDDENLEITDMGTFKELNQLISKSSTVKLNKDYSYDSVGDRSYIEGVVIDKDMTITGNGHTIYGNEARIFIIKHNAKVTIDGLRFVNTKGYYYDYGGSIYNTGDLTIKNCEFINSTAVYDGGAIISNGTLRIYSSRFDNNTAMDVYHGNESDGGAIYSIGSCLIDDCVFSSNTAQFGGAIFTGGTAYIYNSVFLLNSATSTGGCVYSCNSSSCLVEKSQFIYNAAQDAGALFQCLANLTYFMNNYAYSEGNNMILGVALDCSPLTDDNDYCYVDLLFNVKLSVLTQSITYGDKVNVKVTDIVGENPIPRINVKIRVNTGSGYKTFSAVTNENGIASIPFTVTPNSYIAAVTSDEQSTILSGSTTAKLLVKKATLKIIASKKVYKVKTKSKKYTITIKNSKGNTIKGFSVKIKVNGKKYSAKTNSKGKATFNINKLTKKGSFKSTITVAGTKNYNKVSKTVTIVAK